MWRILISPSLELFHPMNKNRFYFERSGVIRPFVGRPTTATDQIGNLFIWFFLLFTIIDFLDTLPYFLLWDNTADHVGRYVIT